MLQITTYFKILSKNYFVSHQELLYIFFTYLTVLISFHYTQQNTLARLQTIQ